MPPLSTYKLLSDMILDRISAERLKGISFSFALHSHRQFSSTRLQPMKKLNFIL